VGRGKVEEIVLRTHRGEDRRSLVSGVDHRPSHILDLHAVNRNAVPTQSNSPVETCRADESINAELFRLFLASASGGMPAARARGCR
jgi:hypothetical protein